MVNLKKLLTNITQKLKELTDNPKSFEWAQFMCKDISTTTTSTSDVFLSTFQPASSQGKKCVRFLNKNQDIFAEDTNGIKVLKDGKYFVHIDGHINCTANTSIRVRIYANDTLYLTRRFYDYSVGWVGYSMSGIFNFNANDVIKVSFAKNSGATANTLRPTYFNMSMIYYGA